MTRKIPDTTVFLIKTERGWWCGDNYWSPLSFQAVIFQDSESAFIKAKELNLTEYQVVPHTLKCRDGKVELIRD